MARTSADRKKVSLLNKRVGLIPLFMLGAVLFAACGQSLGAGSSGGAPDFTFNLYQGQDVLGGQEVQLSSLRGKPVVLNFWAGLCPPCRAEMPDLQGFYEEFSSQVTLVGVDVGQFTGLGSRNDAQNLLAELEITYPAGFTDSNKAVRAYRVLSMPTTVFITAEGDVFRTWAGALNREILSEITMEMLEAS